MTDPRCFFEDWEDVGPCEGRIVKAHLVKRQVLLREGHPEAIEDPRSWIPVCGGWGYGNAGHHGQMDHSRTLHLQFSNLPFGFIELMDGIGMSWYVDKHYAEEARS
jgi:hypothetical protein